MASIDESGMCGGIERALECCLLFLFDAICLLVELVGLECVMHEWNDDEQHKRDEHGRH